MTEMTETRPDRLRKILEQVRHQGYCISNQEAFVGDISIAAPVFDEGGQAIAAVNIAVPTPRWSMTGVQHKLMPVVREVASDLSAALGLAGRSARAGSP
jgi:DNA-binding IclR family transcriptional regulator